MNTATKARNSTACSLRNYGLVPERLYHPDLGEYHTYGVRVTAPEYTNILHDVSACKQTAEWIVEQLNRHQVAPVHLYDIVTDLLP